VAEQLLRDTVRQRTWERYEQIARVHLKPALGRVKLKNLTPTQVRGLYRSKLDAGLSPRTVQYVHTALRKALKDVVADGLVPRNATDGIKAPRPKKRRSTRSHLNRRAHSSTLSLATAWRPCTFWLFTRG
jgi:integrase